LMCGLWSKAPELGTARS